MATCVFCNGGQSTSHEVQAPCSQKEDGSHCQACQDLVDLEAKIVEATENLLKMRKKRVKLLTEVNRTHDSIIHRLPTEIFTEILQQSLPSVGEYAWSNANAAQRLTQVSSHWRNFVISVPSLWTTVPIFIHRNQNPQVVADFLPSLLGRSGTMPLVIHFRVMNPIDSDTREYWNNHRTTMKQLVGTINQQSHRMTALFATAPYIWLDLLDIRSIGAPNLQELRLITPLNVSENVGQLRFRTSSQRIGVGPAINPARLSLERWTFSELDLGTHRLVHLEVTHLTVEACLDLLRHCPTLETCVISEMLRPPVILDLGHLAFRHVNLQNLYISSKHSTPALLSALELPVLQHFRAHDIKDESFFEDLLSLLEQSGPPLQVLDLKLHKLYSLAPGDDPALTIRETLASILDIVRPHLEYFSLQTSACPDFGVMKSHLLVDAVFPGGIPWPSLRSMTIFEVGPTWLLMLCRLVERLSEAEFGPTRPQIKMQLWLPESSCTTDIAVGVLLESSASRVKNPNALSKAIPRLFSFIDENSLDIVAYLGNEEDNIFPAIVRQLQTLCGVETN